MIPVCMFKSIQWIPCESYYYLFRHLLLTLELFSTKVESTHCWRNAAIQWIWSNSKRTVSLTFTHLWEICLWMMNMLYTDYSQYISLLKINCQTNGQSTINTVLLKRPGKTFHMLPWAFFMQIIDEHAFLTLGVNVANSNSLTYIQTIVCRRFSAA